MWTLWKPISQQSVGETCTIRAKDRMWAWAKTKVNYFICCIAIEIYEQGTLADELVLVQKAVFAHIHSPHDFKTALDRGKLDIRIVEDETVTGGRMYSVHDLFRLAFWVVSADSIAWPLKWMKDEYEFDCANCFAFM